MKGVFENSIKNIRNGFNNSPFLSYNIIYVFFIVIAWSRVDVWLFRYNFITQIFLLAIIPIFLFFYEAYRIKQAQEARILSFRESRILPKHDVDRLRSLLPDSQIDLFESVLLPSLSAFYLAFSEISQKEYYKQRLEVICDMIKELKDNPALYSNQQQYKYRDIALTAFYFYRTLFNGAVVFFQQNCAHKSASFYDDKWILLKRVPAKLSLILGEQYWRLYEFWEAVYGNPDNLRLNSDIVNYFKSNSESTLISISDESYKKSKRKIVDQFIDWVIKKANSNDKQYRLNEGHYVFVSPLLYDSSIFITDALLNTYCEITKVTQADLETELIHQKMLDNKRYAINAGEAHRVLLRLNDISLKRIKKVARKKVLIEEV